MKHSTMTNLMVAAAVAAMLAACTPSAAMLGASVAPTLIAGGGSAKMRNVHTKFDPYDPAKAPLEARDAAKGMPPLDGMKFVIVWSDATSVGALVYPEDLVKIQESMNHPEGVPDDKKHHSFIFQQPPVIPSTDNPRIGHALLRDLVAGIKARGGEVIGVFPNYNSIPAFERATADVVLLPSVGIITHPVVRNIFGADRKGWVTQTGHYELKSNIIMKVWDDKSRQVVMRKELHPEFISEGFRYLYADFSYRGAFVGMGDDYPGFDNRGTVLAKALSDFYPYLVRAMLEMLDAKDLRERLAFAREHPNTQQH